jgi:D-galactarolactone cycloisomerase
MMQRRQFLILAAATAMTSILRAETPRDDVKITSVTGYDLLTKRVKLVGKNARLGVHGDSSRDRVVVLHASDGSEGLGCCHADEKQLKSLLGKTPRDLLDPRTNRITVLGTQTMPIWDLLGKLAKKPAYQLFSTNGGAASSADVRVYDGSIYFSDLLDQYQHNWQDRFKEEVDEILSRGHRAFKVKIGRGNKWMARDEGDARDIEVLKIVRAHAGKDVVIAVDANNGYGLDRTKQLLEALPDFNFHFVEEMFPEAVEKDLALKEFIAAHKLKTLVADGETQPNVDALKPLMAAKAIDLYQLDVNGVGCDGLLEEAALCAPYGEKIAPHAWGTLVGFYAQLHVGRAIPNFYSGEQDPLSSTGLIAEGYSIKNGLATVPDSAGFGLKLNLKSDQLKRLFELKA